MLNQCWVNVGPPSVSLAHIQRGAQHDTVTQYWANVGSAYWQCFNISPTLGQRLVLDAFTIESTGEKLMGDSQTETDRADRGKAVCPHLWVHRGDIINKLCYFSRNHDFKIWLFKGLTSREYLIQTRQSSTLSCCIVSMCDHEALVMQVGIFVIKLFFGFL